MDRVALDFGFIQIYWYSIFIFIGIFLASLVVITEAKKQKINLDFIVNLIFYTTIFGLIGARLYYVAFNLDYYLKYPIEILETWNGGMAIHGGIIAGLLTVIVYTRKYRAKTLKVLDISVVGLILGQAIGRWGNFFNGEAYGAVVSFEKLKSMGLPNFLIDGMYQKGAYHHPAFLYESIWDLTGFIALLIIRRYKYLKTGQLTGVYLIWYSVGRFFVEGMRVDSLMLGDIRIAQLVSIICIIIGVILLIVCKKGTRFDNLYKDKDKKEILF